MIRVRHSDEIPDEDRSSSFERMLRALDLGADIADCGDPSKTESSQGGFRP
jgi:hypothetical protein